MLGLLHAHHVKLDASILHRHRQDPVAGGAEPSDRQARAVVINNLLPRVSVPVGLLPAKRVSPELAATPTPEPRASAVASRSSKQ